MKHFQDAIALTDIYNVFSWNAFQEVYEIYEALDTDEDGLLSKSEFSE